MQASANIRFKSSAGRIKRKERLLRTFNEDPAVSRKVLMDELGVSEDTLRVYVRELSAEDLLPQEALKGFRAQGRAGQRRDNRPKKPIRKLSPEKRRGHLLRMMRADPTISVEALAEWLNTSTRSVERDRAELRRDGFINGTGRRLTVAANTFGAKRELDMRRLLGLLKDDPTLTRGALANSLGVHKTQVTILVKTLKARGSLPRTFSLRRKQSYERMHQKMDARRAARRPTILTGVSENLTQREIAWMLGCNDMTVSTDIKAMRYLKDSGLAEAERVRDALRGPSRPETTSSEEIHAEMVKALEEVGLTMEEAAREHLDWKENANFDDPLTRENTVTK